MAGLIKSLNITDAILSGFTVFLLYRGDDFRTDYRRIGELRALIPPSVHVMALTATATRSSRMKILQSLRMMSQTTISISPP